MPANRCELRPTIATQQGESRIWGCRECGACICVPTRDKPAGACPACQTAKGWHEEFAPVSVFAAVREAMEDPEEGYDMPAKQPVNVARVQQLLAQGVQQKAIAERLGIAKGVVSQIAAGKYVVKEAHVCEIARTCRCSIVGLEPHDDCPMHGCGEWPPRCGQCGKYLVREAAK